MFYLHTLLELEFAKDSTKKVCHQNDYSTDFQSLYGKSQIYQQEFAEELLQC